MDRKVVRQPGLVDDADLIVFRIKPDAPLLSAFDQHVLTWISGRITLSCPMRAFSWSGEGTSLDYSLVTAIHRDLGAGGAAERVACQDGDRSGNVPAAYFKPEQVRCLVLFNAHAIASRPLVQHFPGPEASVVYRVGMHHVDADTRRRGFQRGDPGKLCKAGLGG